MSDIDIEAATEYLKNYWSTYADQKGYKDYKPSTFLDDALYGIGVSMGERYRYAGGYREFLLHLEEHIGSECAWKPLDGDMHGTYETECENMFSVVDGTVESNAFEYCPYCGGLIVDVDEQTGETE